MVRDEIWQPVLRLKAFEMHLSGLVGLHRQVESILNDRGTRFPEQFPNQLFASHIVGAMAEFAVAKELGVEWVGHVNHFSQPDLALRRGAKVYGCEVRYSPARRDIKVKETDADFTIVVGVTGLPPEFEILGFCRAGAVKEACVPMSPAKGKPAFFCPPDMYKNIEELKAWLSGP